MMVSSISRSLCSLMRVRTYTRFVLTEFAEFTSAQERIALGKKSRKLEAKKRRENMNELIADAYVSSLFTQTTRDIHSPDREEEDEETMEWEQEQLRRGGLRTESPAASAPKPVYKAASSASTFFVYVVQENLLLHSSLDHADSDLEHSCCDAVAHARDSVDFSYPTYFFDGRNG